jgi:putative transposase
VKVYISAQRIAIQKVYRALWRRVKDEEIYSKEYRSVRELISSLKRYFDFHNTQRPHAGLHRNTPSEVYSGCLMVAM